MPDPVSSPALNASSIAGTILVEVFGGRKGASATPGRGLDARESLNLIQHCSSGVYSVGGGPRSAAMARDSEAKCGGDSYGDATKCNGRVQAR